MIFVFHQEIALRNWLVTGKDNIAFGLTNSGASASVGARGTLTMSR